MTAILNNTPEPPARYKSGVSEELERIVAKALAKDKAERYQHVDDMVADLRREARLSESAGSTLGASTGQAASTQTGGAAAQPGSACSRGDDSLA